MRRARRAVPRRAVGARTACRRHARRVRRAGAGAARRGDPPRRPALRRRRREGRRDRRRRRQRGRGAARPRRARGARRAGRRAPAAWRTVDLAGCELYGSARACALCEAAAARAGIARMYYGAAATDGGAPRAPRCNRQPSRRPPLGGRRRPPFGCAGGANPALAILPFTTTRRIGACDRRTLPAHAYDDATAEARDALACATRHIVEPRGTARFGGSTACTSAHSSCIASAPARRPPTR